MVRAYVSIPVVENLKKINGVTHADVVFGEYDVTAFVGAEDAATLSKIITKIRSKTKGVGKTSTMITQEGCENVRR